MSPHLRRAVVVGLTLAIPLARAATWLRAAARWGRYRFGKWNHQTPGLPVDGELLTYEETRALGAIDRGWKTAPERTRRP